MRPLSREEFDQLAQEDKYYRNYWGTRWNYFKTAIDIVSAVPHSSILELGAHKTPIIVGSDTMGRVDSFKGSNEYTYNHDATKTPWPIGDKQYDCFVALQVWEHLQGKQQEAFKEVMRISKNAVLSFPHKWDYVDPIDGSDHNVTKEMINDWCCGVKPRQIVNIDNRLVYHFDFENKKPVVYVAILNKGKLRRELFKPLIKMLSRKDMVVIVEDLSKTWAHPISANRNKIQKRMLECDADFLLMIDDDVAPSDDPLDYVYADKDVIGFPAKVRAADKTLQWVAYVKPQDAKEEDEGYLPMDFDRLPAGIDLCKCEIVGTGCILIKRSVLENIPNAFSCEWMPDGSDTIRYGTDFAFCRRAVRGGHEVFVAPNMKCQHFKEVELSTIPKYREFDGLYKDNQYRGC
jgi:hypothetical protein